MGLVEEMHNLREEIESQKGSRAKFLSGIKSDVETLKVQTVEMQKKFRSDLAQAASDGEKGRRDFVADLKKNVAHLKDSVNHFRHNLQDEICHLHQAWTGKDKKKRKAHQAGTR